MTAGAIVFHGVWNGMAIGAGIAPILIYGSDPTLGQQLLFYVPFIVWLVVGCILLALINRHLQKQQQLEESSGSTVNENQEEIQVANA